eukprot:Awhi_evm1s13522
MTTSDSRHGSGLSSEPTLDTNEKHGEKQETDTSNSKHGFHTNYSKGRRGDGEIRGTGTGSRGSTIHTTICACTRRNGTQRLLWTGASDNTRQTQYNCSAWSTDRWII